MYFKPWKYSLPGTLFLVLLALVALPLRAQLPTGAILGTVTDASQAVLPGTSVTVTNVGTGYSRTQTTEANGSYRFDALPIGNYQLRVSNNGFKTQIRKGIVLAVAQQEVVPITLEVGAATETVTVAAAPPQVDITTPTLGGLMTPTSIQDLPLNGRNLLDLTMLQTGVSNVTTYYGPAASAGTLGQGNDEFTSNGAPIRSNDYLLDGAIMQNAWGSTPTSIAGTTLGVDGIQEFKVITNLFDAQYGLTMGSQTTMVSKAGTNNFHGDIFEYARNAVFDARNYFDQGALPPFSRNQFGGAVGGPIKKNKAFFEANYEGFIQNLSLSDIVSNLPESTCHVSAGTQVTMWNGVGAQPTGSCYDPLYVNPVDPTLNSGTTTMSAIGAQLLALTPAPNAFVGDVTSAYVNSYASNPSQPTSVQHGQVRFDDNVSAADSFFVRYTVENASQVTPAPTPGLTSTLGSLAQYLTLSENHIVSPKTINVARFSYSRFNLNGNSTGTSTFSQPAEVTGSTLSGGYVMNGGYGIGVGEPGSSISPQTLDQSIYTWSDDIFWNKGKHAFQFGTLINHFDQPQSFAISKFGGLTFYRTTDIINGMVIGYGFAPPSSNQSRDYHYNTFGFYAQDNWHVLQRLTLNLGLRYEPRSNIVNNGVQQYYFSNFAADNPLNTPAAGTVPGNIVQNDSLHNFAPRIGFAWDVFGNGKTAVRGGAGLYYDIANVGAEASNAIFSTPPTSYSVSVQGLSTPVPACLPLDTCFPVSSQGQYPFDGMALSTLDYHAKQPYMGQYNLTVEHQLPAGMVLSVSYVGSRGIHLWNIMEGNPAVPDQVLNAQNPQCGTPNAPANCSQAGVSGISKTPGGLTWMDCIAAAPAASTGLPTTNPLTDPNNPNACRLNPYYGDYTLNTTKADSWYNSLQASFQKITGNWNFQTSYTFSKALDDGEGAIPFGEATTSDSTNPYNPKFDRGPTEYDATHQFEFTTTYHLPNPVKSHKIAAALLNGWWTSHIFTARTGYAFSPVLLYYQNSNDFNTYGGLERPDFVTSANLSQITDPNCATNAWGLAGGGCNPNAVVYDKNKVKLGSPGQWFNPNMFVQQPFGQLGDVPRGVLRGPGFFDWDATMAKDVKLSFLGEAGKLELRADMFNVVNHTTFAAPNGNTIAPGGSVFPLAGLVSATANYSRQFQFSARMEF